MICHVGWVPLLLFSGTDCQQRHRARYSSRTFSNVDGRILEEQCRLQWDPSLGTPQPDWALTTRCSPDCGYRKKKSITSVFSSCFLWLNKLHVLAKHYKIVRSVLKLSPFDGISLKIQSKSVIFKRFFIYHNNQKTFPLSYQPTEICGISHAK